MSDMDYELHPWTVHAMRTFRDGNDPSAGENAAEKMAEALSEEVYQLDDQTKGLVIIDLLTLNNIFEQVITTLRVDQIEKGLDK